MPTSFAALIWRPLRPALSGLCLVALLAAPLAGCGPKEPTKTSKGTPPRPHKPGESITHTQMCTCVACEPTSCCSELDREEGEPQQGCAQGSADSYDFSQCQSTVSSCDSRCFHHRWRTRIEVGCDGSRPDACCYAQSSF